MKAAIIALIFLILLVSVLSIYSHLLVKEAEDLYGKTLALRTLPQPMRIAEAKKIAAYWNNRKILFSLSTSEVEIDRADHELTRLLTAAETENGGEFYLAAASLADAFESIGNVHKITADNVF